MALIAVAGIAGAAEPCGKSWEGNWVAAWGTAQQLAQPARAVPAAVTPPPRVAAQTVRMVTRPTVSGFDVRAPAKAATIVAFGDSITDGFSTTPDADLAWPSILARRLGAQRNQAPRAVINMGISGNRVLREGAGSSALARFDRDVLSRPGTRWVLLLEGINDIGFLAFARNNPAEQVTAEDIITGYRLLIERAHLHGITIIGGTLMPFEGVPTWSEAGERMRQQVNQWIRTSGAFDAVVDFDAATRDPAMPAKLRPEYDSGDHIHPNDAGNKAMADAIDLKLFR